MTVHFFFLKYIFIFFLIFFFLNAWSHLIYDFQKIFLYRLKFLIFDIKENIPTNNFSYKKINYVYYMSKIRYKSRYFIKSFQNQHYLNTTI